MLLENLLLFLFMHPDDSVTERPLRTGLTMILEGTLLASYLWTLLCVLVGLSLSILVTQVMKVCRLLLTLLRLVLLMVLYPLPTVLQKVD